MMAYDKIMGKKGNEIHINIELHPGEVLADELKSRNITKSAMALQLGMYPSHFNDIVNKKGSITTSIALKLEKEFGIDAEFWLGLQMDYDLYVERNKRAKSA